MCSCIFTHITVCKNYYENFKIARNAVGHNAIYELNKMTNQLHNIYTLSITKSAMNQDILK